MSAEVQCSDHTADAKIIIEDGGYYFRITVDWGTLVSLTRQTEQVAAEIQQDALPSIMGR